MKKHLKQTILAIAVLYSATYSKVSYTMSDIGEEFVEDYEEFAGNGLIGFGLGGSVLVAGAADCNAEASAGTPKKGIVNYETRIGVTGLIEGAYALSERLLLEINAGGSRHSNVNESTTSDTFFTLINIFGNAQAKVLLNSPSISKYILYLGVGGAFNYHKIDFGVLSVAAGKVTVNSTEINVGLKNASNASNFSIVGSVGFMFKADGGFIFDIGYMGNYSMKKAEFKTGVTNSYAHLSPVSHAILGSVKMMA